MGTTRRNLPINDTYKIVRSYYTGGIENGAESCANCNKIITNIAVIENSKNETFNVGLDCAATLSGIADSLGLWNTSANFAEAKAVRAKINKEAKKEGNDLRVFYNFNGVVCFQVGNVTEYKDKDFAATYLSDLLNRVENPTKKDFKAISEAEMPAVDVSHLDFRNDFEAFNFKVNEFTVNVSRGYSTAPNGNVNPQFDIEIFQGAKSIVKTDDRNRNSIIRIAMNRINKYRFENFNI